MAKGDRITTAAFNTIQSATATILGTGSGQSGYGQFVSSSAVVPGQVVSSTQWNNLREDMRRCWRHQTNTDITNTLASVSVLPPALQLITGSTIISDVLLTQYTNFNNNGSSTGIVQRKDTHNAAQIDPGVSIIATNPSRTTAWNATITSTITITFNGYTPAGAGAAITGANHLRCFFNAGGTLNIQCTRTGGTTTGTAPTKNTTWTNMLDGVGRLSFGANATSVSGVGLNTGYVLATTTGFNSAGLTFGGAAVTLLNQPGPTGKYTENDYNITVQKLSNGGLNNQIQFVITFRDDDAGDQTGLGPAVDENVDGTLTVIPTCNRPFGSNVDVPMTIGTSITVSGSNPA